MFMSLKSLNSNKWVAYLQFASMAFQSDIIVRLLFSKFIQFFLICLFQLINVVFVANFFVRKRNC